MNKRSFKDIEEEMKQLANAYEAPFDEQAWVSMEALLDKDKDRKRPPFFLVMVAIANCCCRSCRWVLLIY